MIRFICLGLWLMLLQGGASAEWVDYLKMQMELSSSTIPWQKNFLTGK